VAAADGGRILSAPSACRSGLSAQRSWRFTGGGVGPALRAGLFDHVVMTEWTASRIRHAADSVEDLPAWRSRCSESADRRSTRAKRRGLPRWSFPTNSGGARRKLRRDDLGTGRAPPRRSRTVEADDNRKTPLVRCRRTDSSRRYSESYDVSKWSTTCASGKVGPRAPARFAPEPR